MNFERPRKIYSLTNNGQIMLNFTEDSLNLICRKIIVQPNNEMTIEAQTQSAVSIMPKHSASSGRLAFEMR